MAAPTRLCRSLALAAISLLAAPPAWPSPAGDAPWTNGANHQPAPLLVTGPFTWTMMADVYYGWAFNAPGDHTVFPATTAPRHNEVNLNYGILGIEATGVPDVLGKLVLQVGNYTDTITGTDPTANRGAYSGLTNLRNVQQAYVGYHLPVLGGMNLLAGILPAYIGLESWVPQENWNYTHAVTSDFTPYYVTGAALQVYPGPGLKTEFWLLNGWQSLSKFGEWPGFGWSIRWEPDDRLNLTQNLLCGYMSADQTRLRLYTDTVLQWQYARQPLPWIRSLAINAVGDIGYESAGTAQGAAILAGAALLHRVDFDDRWSLGLRASGFSDPQKAVALALPNNQALPAGPLLVGEMTATLDFRPTPWLLYRLEYRHDAANLPYIAGPGGSRPPRRGTPPFGRT